jgi:hypothetical protein
MKEIFLGKPLYWLIWAVVLGLLYALGELRLHTRDFNLFILIVLALAAVSVFVIVSTYKKGERVTREPFEEE